MTRYNAYPLEMLQRNLAARADFLSAAIANAARSLDQVAMDRLAVMLMDTAQLVMALNSAPALRSR